MAQENDVKTGEEIVSPEEFVPKTARQTFRVWLLAAILALATVALYWPATHNDFVVIDDDLYVTDNSQVQKGLTPESIQWAFGHSVCGNWHPLTMLSHMADCEFYGLKPWGHHLTNIILHAGNTVLIFLLLRLLTGALWRSALVAALFAWHPLRVESVAWVAERKDVLSGCFGFLTLILYARYARARGAGIQEQAMKERADSPPFWRSGLYWAACVCFVPGLLSKPMLVTWPLVLLLLDYWPLGRFQPGRAWALVAEKLPFFALAAATGVAALVAQRQANAVQTFDSLSFVIRCETAPISYCRYLFKMLWPADLVVFYQHPGHWPLGWVLLAGLFLAATTICCWLARRQYPFLLMGWGWYVVTLLPVIGLVQVGGQAIADRYTYIPSVGMLILAVWGLGELAGRRRQLPMLLLAGAAIVLCAALTRQQITYWRDSETLFRHTLQTHESDFAHYDLGLALLQKNDTNAAVSEFQATLLVNPDYVQAHVKMGNVLADEGHADEAIREFQAALGLKPADAEVRYNLGNLLAKQGQTDEALAQYQETIRAKPDFPEAHNNLGSLLRSKDRTSEAVLQFQEAIRLKPDFADAHYNLGNAYLTEGRLDDTISQYQTVVKLLPNFAPARYYLGVALARKGMTAEAVSQIQEAIRLKPDYAMAHDRLGVLFGDQGRLDDAIHEFQAALRIKPDYAEASNNLARVTKIQAGRAGK